MEVIAIHNIQLHMQPTHWDTRDNFSCNIAHKKKVQGWIVETC